MDTSLHCGDVRRYVRRGNTLHVVVDEGTLRLLNDLTPKMRWNSRNMRKRCGRRQSVPKFSVRQGNNFCLPLALQKMDLSMMHTNGATPPPAPRPARKSFLSLVENGDVAELFDEDDEEDMMTSAVVGTEEDDGKTKRKI